MIRTEQERFEKRQRAEEKMTYMMFRELRCGPGPWGYKTVEYKPVESDPEKYELEDEPDEPVAR